MLEAAELQCDVVGGWVVALANVLLVGSLGIRAVYGRSLQRAAWWRHSSRPCQEFQEDSGSGGAWRPEEQVWEILPPHSWQPGAGLRRLRNALFMWLLQLQLGWLKAI